MGGGKSKSQTQTQQTSNNIPDWLSNAGEYAVQRATDLSNKPYTPFTGQIVADTPADTQQAYQQVRNLQGQADPSYQQSLDAYGRVVGQVNPITAQGVNDLTNQLYGNYGANVIAPTASLLSPYLANQGPATAAGVGSNAMSLMSPFASSVIDPTIAAGQQQLALAKQNIANQSNNVGAFGGSRMGVQEGVADAQTALGTQQQIGNMLQSGWNTALQPAYSLEQNRANQGYSADALLAQMFGTGYSGAQTLGQGIANTNLTTGMTAAANMPTVASARSAQDLKDASALQTIGAAQQNQQQQQLNAGMGQFYAEQEDPIQKLDILLSAVGGVPYSTSGTSTTTGTMQKNTAGGVMGGAAQGAGLGFSVGGPWGAAIGAVAGGILGGLS